MRIVIVTHTLTKNGGQGRVSYEIAQGALRRGWHVTLAASEVAPELEAHERVSWQRIPWSSRWTGLHGVLRFANLSTRWLKQNGAQHDVVQANGLTTWAQTDVNTSHFVHGAWLRSPNHIARQQRSAHSAYQGLFTALNARWERQVYQRARVVAPVSQQVGDELRSIGVPSAKQRMIYNGVDLREFCPGSMDRAALGLPVNTPLALFVGDIRTRRKNLDSVLKAVAQVPGLHLAVVGKVEDSPFPALADHLGLADRARFLGFRRDVADIMRACDLFIFPSRYEACSLVILEAIASGLPVVTAQTTGGSEVLTPDCSIRVSDAEDVNGIADAMQNIISSPPAQQLCMRQSARAIASQHSWERMADDYIRLYEEVAR